MNIHSNLLSSGLVFRAVSRTVLLSAVISVASFGAVIYDSGVTSISTNLSVQKGRLSRDGVPDQWAAPTPFPGVLNPALSYGYEAFAIPASPYPYLQISVYDVLNSANVFASAYENAYLPAGTGANLGLDNNYLGYAGQSGNIFNDPRAFQVILPNPSINNLLVVVNDTSTTGAGLRQPFQFLVEGFYDTSFNDTTAPAPEPSAFVLSGGGVFAVALIAFGHRRRTAR